MWWGTGTRPVILFAAFPTKWLRACQDAGSRDGTSSQDPLETPKVKTLDSKAPYGVRPSTRRAPFLRKGWASTDGTAAAPTFQPPWRTDVRRINRPEAAYEAGYEGTRDHHQAIRTGQLKTTPVRRPRVGQRAMPLSTPSLSPTHVPWTSPWNYKRRDPEVNMNINRHNAHT